MHRPLTILTAAIAALIFTCASALAHPGVFNTALLKLHPDGRITLTARIDAVSFALNDLPANISQPTEIALINGPEPALTAALNDARQRFNTQFTISADGTSIPFTIAASPSLADFSEWRSIPDPRLPLRADFIIEAALPPGARTLTLQFPQVLGDIILTADRPGVEPLPLPISAGETSLPFDTGKPTPPAVTDVTTPAPQAEPAHTPWTTTATRFIRLGFTHILPHGLDHVLFVLGLFLLSPRLKPLLWQITAFTIAHSITLALSLLADVSFPPSIVEPAIALSIMLVAVENLATSKLHPWRPAIVFIFGLIHGMGFAGVLKESGLPKDQLGTTLICFNIGVELGQLAVIAAALIAVGWFRNKSWYRKRITIPVSIAIVCIAAFWTFQRITGG